MNIIFRYSKKALIFLISRVNEVICFDNCEKFIFFFNKFMQNFDMIKYCLFKTNGLGNPVTAVSLMLLLSANLLRVH